MMARALTAGTLLAIILVLFGGAGPPSSSGSVHSSLHSLLNPLRI
jgi:hypothetical protein